MAKRISKSLWPGFDPYGVVSYRSIPLYRCQAWALELVDNAGVTPVIISGIRDDAIINQHNYQFGTNLHSQQYLFVHQNQPGFNPANSPATTSHCHHGDGVTPYVPRGGNIPLILNGIDAVNNAKAADIVHTLDRLGFRAVQPYSSGSELHHFSLWPHNTKDYIKRLRRTYLKLWIKRHRKKRR